MGGFIVLIFLLIVTFVLFIAIPPVGIMFGLLTLGLIKRIFSTSEKRMGENSQLGKLGNFFVKLILILFYLCVGFILLFTFPPIGIIWFVVFYFVGRKL